eukprot:TRINITY_DN10411_c0_g1_i3.p1 TRINITY_DN10411_c0_g1~~TRINITY_DN10411_c0_g1_i3.p1  ORF type:complete len:822 (+),score=159.19 TRINITY_DN10411_c0_g1_i3:70-2535(+)
MNRRYKVALLSIILWAEITKAERHSLELGDAHGHNSKNLYKQKQLHRRLQESQQLGIGSEEKEAELSKFIGAWAAGAIASVGQFGGLATSTATAGLATQVAALGSTVTATAGPIVSISSATGLTVGAVSTIVTAGALAGPLLGSAALVVACWPKKEDDPFMRIEGQIAQMIDGKFNEERQRKLSSRLKRYLREFARCTAVFAQMAGVPSEPSHTAALMEFHSHLKGIGVLDRSSNASSLLRLESKLSQKLHSPPCMVQLERIMSLERDEWMQQEGSSLSSLFVPFATMHVQLQNFLKTYPPSGPEPSYEEPAEQTAAEYSGFILGGMHNAWKAQVCRQVRLREHKVRFSSPTYQLTVLRPAVQPNPAKDCFEACGGQDGWCNFCGGAGIGACCKKDAFGSAECRQFDVPVTTSFLGGQKPYHACVHTDCEQHDTEYSPHFFYTDFNNWAECQQRCKNDVRCTHFTFWEEPVQTDPHDEYSDFANCFLSDTFSVRYKAVGAISGPRECPPPVAASTGAHDSGAVPSDEIMPCDLSEPVKEEDFDYGEAWAEYVKKCYKKVAQLVLEDFNPYYARFIQIAENFAVRAGCSKPLTEAEEKDESKTSISETMSFGRFSDCNWDRPKAAPGTKVWYPDPERGTSGIFKNTKVNLERQRHLPGYPGPEWLARRTSLFECLESKFPGSVDEMSGDDVGNLEEVIMKSAEKYEEEVSGKDVAKEDGIMHEPTVDAPDAPEKVVPDEPQKPVANVMDKWCIDNFSKANATCSKLENQNCYPGFTGYRLCERVFSRKCKRASPCCAMRNATNGKVELECAPKPSIEKAAGV